MFIPVVVEESIAHLCNRRGDFARIQFGGAKGGVDGTRRWRRNFLTERCGPIKLDRLGGSGAVAAVCFADAILAATEVAARDLAGELLEQLHAQGREARKGLVKRVDGQLE